MMSILAFLFLINNIVSSAERDMLVFGEYGTSLMKMKYSMGATKDP